MSQRPAAARRAALSGSAKPGRPKGRGGGHWPPAA